MIDCIEIHSIGFDEACFFIERHHRTCGIPNRLSHIQSYMALIDDKPLGIIMFNRPCGSWSSHIKIVELSRICFTPHLSGRRFYKAPSKIVSDACDMFLQDHHVDGFITYIHENERGLYLSHSGFEKDAVVEYGQGSKGWNNRPGRRPSNIQTKIRFFKPNWLLQSQPG